DCYYEAGDLQEARSAYHRALEVQPGDVQARYNLAWVETRQRRYAAALEHLAAALAHDQTCAWYDRLVKKQAEVLQLLAQKQQQQYLLLANRISKNAAAEPD